MIEKVLGKDPFGEDMEDLKVVEDPEDLKEAEAAAALADEARAEEAEMLQPDLIEDFSNISGSVYEAVMIASKRARQIGRTQKEEIDAWNKSLESTMIEEELTEEESSFPEKREFNFQKPIIQALSEMKSGKFTFHYKDDK